LERHRYLIVGGDTPLGADLRETLVRNDPAARVQLAGSTDSESSLLTVSGGEAAVISGLRVEEFAGADAVFLTGAAESSRRAEIIAAEMDKPPLLIDLVRAPGATGRWSVRAPSIETGTKIVRAGERVAIAHPVAVALAAILRGLHGHSKVRRAIATAFLPASEWGREGIDELHKQTINLLAFHRLPQAVFDTQLAFNVLSQYGEEAPASLESVSSRVAADLQLLLKQRPALAMPSVRILQAPCMHGIAISLWIEFASAESAKSVAAAFAGDRFDLRDGTVEAPTMVGMAAQDGIGIGAIEQDRANEKACWLFAAADNYRLMAQEASAVARLAAGGARR
jgi:aspartate-semialdehyde dehydrogenase